MKTAVRTPEHLPSTSKHTDHYHRLTQQKGRAMAQDVSRRSLTAARVRSRVGPCRICGGQSGTGTGFSRSTSVLPCQFHSVVCRKTDYRMKRLRTCRKTDCRVTEFYITLFLIDLQGSVI
jgi:hypothetical protein